MINLKLICSIVLLIMTPVLAANIKYIIHYQEGEKVLQSIFSSEIDRSYIPLIVNRMESWSHGKYDARVGDRSLLVYKVNAVIDYDHTRGMFSEMKRVIERGIQSNAISTS
ncbi:hypothetical protein K461DRAFT_130109 [Myriangium duriaei CBS 260.36]|uniref:Uncharacterized protein n=1 Tax=Myriangium duriaei CBS 260.36 TaxID=1168546 RepID=A0A9P4J5L8_9PEZI|nr:hypothetical protein K461DRAFT_130109 [Myriangium duriaei CBS 260.36]